MVTERDLEERVSELAEELAVPGVAVGVSIGDDSHQAFHGVTSVEDPLPVDAGTLFQIGSTGKTYTATAIMQLVEQGRLDLNARVRNYVPELRLKDEQVARDVTVLHLLNHTAGWDGDLFEDQGEGDDAIDRYVARMGSLDQVTPLGEVVSYNNASYGLAGLLIERLTGTTYEHAITEMLLNPLGLDRSLFFAKQIMTYRFSNGHVRSEDGTTKVTRPWDTGRYGVAMGGLSSNVADQLAWARFHLGDGTAPDGSQLLSKRLLQQMQRPTVECPGNDLGDAIGICWLLRDVEGTQVVAHGGDMTGQHSIFEMVPERRFVITSLTNCGPNGGEFNERIKRWAFDEYLGIEITDPDPVRLDEQTAAEYVGRYETIASVCDVTSRDGVLMLDIKTRPEVREQLGGEDTDEPPLPLGMLPGEGDRYVVTGGPSKGLRGYFARDPTGAITAVHFGRFARRTT